MLNNTNKIKNLNEMELSFVENLPLNLVLEIPLEILFTLSKIYKNNINAFGSIIVKRAKITPLKLKFVSINVIVKPRVNPFKDKVTKVIGENKTLVLNKTKTNIGVATVKNVVFKVCIIVKFPFWMAFMYSIKSFLRYVTISESKYVNK